LSLSNLGQPGISDKMGSISTRMTERFGCRHPFASAGMAFAGGTSDLALAVCAGGGIGAVGVGLTPAEQLRAIIHEIRAATDAPFNINLITFFDMTPRSASAPKKRCRSPPFTGVIRRPST
jgi:NAD(P)H-dependent flavin oxidoreductase YrpB (nitropropane dioxygenase family)